MNEVPPPENVGNDNWKPLLIFTDESPSFAHGAEFGMIWERFKTKTFKPQAVRVENEEVLRACAAHFGFTATFEDSGTEGWLFMDIEPFKLKAV